MCDVFVSNANSKCNRVWLLIDMKCHIDIECYHINIESFYRFIKIVIAPAPN
jgi:hypothetical protein